MDGKQTSELTEDDLVRLLEQHAELLVRGVDTTGELVGRYSRSPLLVSLLTLAQRLYRTLVPVEPSERYVARLKARLSRAQARQLRRSMRWQAWHNRTGRVGLLRGALSVLALMAIVAQVIGSIVMLVLLIIGYSKRRPAAA